MNYGATIGLSLGVFIGNVLFYGLIEGKWRAGFAIGFLAAILCFVGMWLIS